MTLAAGGGELPGTSSVALSFNNLQAFRSSLLQLLQLQSGRGESTATFARWSLTIHQKCGFSLFTTKGWKRLGLDPEARFGAAFLGRKARVFLFSASLGEEGVWTGRLHSLLRSISGYSGVVCEYNHYRLRVVVFDRLKEGFALRYGIYKNRILITNHDFGLRAGYGALLFHNSALFSAPRSPFRNAPFRFTLTPAGLNGLFRHQLPYDPFFQEHPLQDFFRRVDGGFYPEESSVRLRLDTAGASHFYLRRARQLLRMGSWRPTPAALPLDLSMRFHSATSLHFLLSRLSEQQKTAFYIWTIKMLNRHKLHVMRDVAGGWNGKLRVLLIEEKDQAMPLIGLGLYSSRHFKTLLRFFTRSGITGEFRKKGAVYSSRFRKSFLFFRGEIFLRFTGRMLWISSSFRAINKIEETKRQRSRERFSFQLRFVPARLAPLICAEKDKRSDLASFLKGLSSKSLFRIRISLSGRYLNIRIGRNSTEPTSRTR